jgi:peptide/nickel transport system substrate-binding protein
LPRPHAITHLALVALVAVVACGARDRRTPDETMIVVVDAPMVTADPRYAISNLDMKLAHVVASGLVTVDTPDAAPRLDLAAAITPVDPLTVDVTLREGARFSDGQPVTADDVVRTYRSEVDPKCGAITQKEFAERFASFEVLGPERVRFHLRQTLGTFVTDIDFGILSFHGVPPGSCEVPRVIGAGPYELRRLTSRAAYLDANPYYDRPPKLPHLEFRFVTDTAARALMLVGGSADLVQNAIRPDLVDDLATRPRVRLATAPSLILSFMLLNNDDPLLHDVRVRRAIALAIDRPAIVEAKLGGRAVLATGLLPPTHWAYNGNVVHYDRDLARANALLDEAGHPRDEHGVRFHLVYKTSNDSFRISIAHVLASQLAEVGIEVEIRPFEFATFFADIKKGNYQIATMQTAEITEPDYYLFYFHSSRVPDAEHPDLGNRWHYRNPELDRWLDAGRHEVDFAKRRPIYAEVQRIVAEDVPVIPLWHEDIVVLTNAEVRGYEIVPDARFVGLVGVTKPRP